MFFPLIYLKAVKKSEKILQGIEASHYLFIKGILFSFLRVTKEFKLGKIYLCQIKVKKKSGW